MPPMREQTVCRGHTGRGNGMSCAATRRRLETYVVPEIEPLVDMKYPRRDNPAERAHVARVVITAADREREYRDCWIHVDRETRRVLVWRDPRAEAPDASAPVADVDIDWGPRRGRGSQW